MLGFTSRDSSAAELLEASKKLYVKTDLLKQTRVGPGQPRLFESADNEKLAFSYKKRYQPPCGSEDAAHNQVHDSVLASPLICIPSSHSAFRQPNEPPPRPPKSDNIRQKITGLRPQEIIHNPPPVPPRKLKYETTDFQNVKERYTGCGWKPLPKPRLSKMNSFSSFSNSINEYPRPKPRHKTTVISRIPSRILEPSFNSNPRKCIAKSSPNLSTSHFTVAALKRKLTLMRPATPIISIQYAVVKQYFMLIKETKIKEILFKNPPMFPLMDESERVFLNEAIRRPYSTGSDDDSGASTPTLDERLLLDKSCYIQSPTADSGKEHSDDDEKRTHPCSSKSIDDGFFDLSVRKREDFISSEPLASISNLQNVLVDMFLEREEHEHSMSVLERNARIMRWIHDCELEKTQ